MRVEGPSAVPTPSRDRSSCSGGAAEWQGIQSFGLTHTGQSPKGRADGRRSPAPGFTATTHPGAVRSLILNTPRPVCQTSGMAHKRQQCLRGRARALQRLEKLHDSGQKPPPPFSWSQPESGSLRGARPREPTAAHRAQQTTAWLCTHKTKQNNNKIMKTGEGGSFK